VFFGAPGFESSKKAFKSKLPINGLRAIVRSGDREAGWNVTNRGRRTDLVDVLTARTAGSRKAFLQILRTDSESVHSLEEVTSASHTQIWSENLNCSKKSALISQAWPHPGSSIATV
jgi:hypothetical protein